MLYLIIIFSVHILYHMYACMVFMLVTKLNVAALFITLQL